MNPGVVRLDDAGGTLSRIRYTPAALVVVPEERAISAGCTSSSNTSPHGTLHRETSPTTGCPGTPEVSEHRSGVVSFARDLYANAHLPEGIDVQDGSYLLSFSADGYSGSGHVNVAGKKFAGSDGCYRVTGDLFEFAGKLEGVVVVHAVPGASHPAHMPDSFVLNVSGTEQADGFTVIGTGPLGIIIELESKRIK